MPKATFLDSILGRPSQTYSMGWNGTSTAPAASQSEYGAPSDLLSTPVPAARPVQRVPRTAGSDSGAMHRRKTSRLPGRDDTSGLVPDMNTVNPFSRWWESRSMAAANPAATEPSEPFAERWRREMAARPRGRTRSEAGDVPALPHGSLAPHTSPRHAYEPVTGVARRTSQRAAPAAVQVPYRGAEAGPDLSELGVALTQDASIGSVAQPALARGPTASATAPIAPQAVVPSPSQPATSTPKQTVPRSDGSPDALRLSWPAALYLADHATPERSPEKPLAYTPTPKRGPQRTLFATATPRSASAPMQGQTTPRAQVLPPRNVQWQPRNLRETPTTPAALEPSPELEDRTAPGLLAVPDAHSGRLSTISVADSVLADLDPSNAPWTMTSEVGHLDRSELHGTHLASPDESADTSREPAPVPGAARVSGYSVLDRPRRRGPRPTEMGGIAIAHGHLTATAPQPRKPVERLSKPPADVPDFLSTDLPALELSPAERPHTADRAPAPSAPSGEPSPVRRAGLAAPATVSVAPLVRAEPPQPTTPVRAAEPEPVLGEAAREDYAAFLQFAQGDSRPAPAPALPVAPVASMSASTPAKSEPPSHTPSSTLPQASPAIGASTSLEYLTPSKSMPYVPPALQSSPSYAVQSDAPTQLAYATRAYEPDDEYEPPAVPVRTHTNHVENQATAYSQPPAAPPAAPSAPGWSEQAPRPPAPPGFPVPPSFPCPPSFPRPPTLPPPPVHGQSSAGYGQRAGYGHPPVPQPPAPAPITYAQPHSAALHAPRPRPSAWQLPALRPELPQSVSPVPRMPRSMPASPMPRATLSPGPAYALSPSAVAHPPDAAYRAASPGAYGMPLSATHGTSDAYGTPLSATHGTSGAYGMPPSATHTALPPPQMPRAGYYPSAPSSPVMPHAPRTMPLSPAALAQVPHVRSPASVGSASSPMSSPPASAYGRSQRYAPPRAQMVMPPSERERLVASPSGGVADGRHQAAASGMRRLASPIEAEPTAQRRVADDAVSSVSTLRPHGSPLDTREPSLAASTSVLSPSTASAMKKAPLGASTNQYLGINNLRNASTTTLAAGSPAAPAASSASVSAAPTRTSSRPGRATDEAQRGRPTMLTVNLTSGNSGAPSTRRRDSFRRRAPSVDAIAPEPGAASSKASVVLSSHAAPPRKIHSSQVLVQVIAVAIDGVDRALMRDRMQNEPHAPFVPGRSFCGRVVDCGYDVKKLRMGDIVFGLQDFRRCGALAEFMCIDQEHVALAPENCLSNEQIAALPATGVMVHQIVQNHCTMLPRGARVLILNAHDGVGLLALQESSRLGLVVIAHVPTTAADGVSICQANGAAEVITGDALWAINLLHESSFHLVIDTEGGRHIYDACRRILAHQGQFVTCYGDDQELPIPTNRSHLRSLRRSFFRKDRKGLGYEWIGIDAGIETRAALESIKAAAQRGAICPRIQSIIPIEDAPRAFEDAASAGVVVVRVS